MSPDFVFIVLLAYCCIMWIAEALHLLTTFHNKPSFHIYSFMMLCNTIEKNLQEIFIKPYYLISFMRNADIFTIGLF